MTEHLLFIDFETSSKTDLTEAGLGRYLDDPTTRAYCFTFRLPGMSTADLWEEGQPIPAHIVRHIKNGGLFVAHNAPFDFWMWNLVLRRQRGYHDLPEIQIGQVRCSAARARYNGLPGSLAGACEALGLPVQKDIEGAKWMKEIAANPDWTPSDHPEHFSRTYKYALIDTDAMVGVWENTVPLPPREQAYFEMDMRINARGIGVDVEAAQAMEDLKSFAEAQLDYEMAYLTDGGVLAVTEVAKIKEYAATLGEDMDDAGRETLKKIAARDNLPDSLRQLIELRLDASRAPKKSAAILRAHVGGRLQHHTIYHGALSGRSTARGAGGAQTLNTARPRPGKKTADCEAILDACLRGDRAYLSSPEVGPILAALADAQRQLFRATKPGHVLVGADLSGIEARMAPWLANDVPKLEAFEKGVDGYKLAAMDIYGVEYDAVTKDQRQVGKCLGGDTEVLTSEGWKRIIDVKPSDLLWDGEEWVAHAGVVCNGERETMQIDGITCTPDHQFWTGQEWREAKDMSASHRASALATGAEALSRSTTSGRAETATECPYGATSDTKQK